MEAYSSVVLGLFVIFSFHPYTARGSNLTAATTSSTSSKSCTKDEFQYVYTECDQNNGRWKVAVPKKSQTCKLDKPPAPERGTKCSFTCPEGQYLDIASQKCQKCEPGTFSMSGGLKFASWDKLPTGFDTWGINPVGDDDEDREDSKCKSKGWKAKGEIIESAGDNCKSLLVYSVTLEKPGNISIVHRADDEMAYFHVKVSNNFCTATRKGKHNFLLDPEITWKRTFVPLERGRNVISLVAAYFYGADTFGFGSHDDESKDSDDDKDSGDDDERSKIASRRAIQVKEIKITGLSYTSECTKCDAGTYSAAGASSCKKCDANTFSAGGAAMCTKCGSNEYSDRGAPKCLKKQPCTNKDFYEMWSPCDENGKTKKSYFWVIPKICEGGIPIPKETKEISCPPCNLGQFKNGTTCSFCKPTEYSDGSGCKKCPPSTTADIGLFFTWWQNLPKDFFNFYCLSKTDRSCKSKNGWRQYNTYLDSGVGHSDDTEVGVFFDVPGFIKKHSVLTIEFEVNCKSQCRLILEKRHTQDSATVIFNIRGTKKKTKYTHELVGTGKTAFHLKFIKPEGDPKNLYEFAEDSVKLYALNITNAINGGADRCISCPLGVGNKGSGCIQCSKGKYLDGKKCTSCPKGTRLNTKNPVGRSACIPCGAGTKSREGSTSCYSDCHLHSEEGRHYDLTALAGSMIRKNGKMFTSHGYPYYRIFNITLCGAPNATSHCYNNFTKGEDKESMKSVIPASIQSAVCRSTVIPSKNELDVFAQSMSLGDYLETVTFGSLNKLVKNGTTSSKKKRRRVRRDHDDLNDTLPIDVNFIFKSHNTNSRCSNGYSTIVTLRCDPTAIGKGRILTSPDCPTGTCDGCQFHFFWHSVNACPLCTYTDYQNITAKCDKGVVETHHVWNYPKLCRDGVKLPISTSRGCTVFERTILDLKLFLFVFLGMGLLLLIGIVILYNRNRKLKYKYSRLIDEASYKDGELPASEKCTLDEGEEEEIVLSRGPTSNGRRILDRLRKIGSPKNRDDFGDFETINLTEKHTEHSSGDEI